MYRVLIVEDESLERNTLKKIISDKFSNTVEVLDACDGEQAVNMAIENEPDIIIMDLHLGSTNGINISKIILEEVILCRIIILTAYDYFSYAQEAVKIGVRDFLLKPVNEEELIKAVQTQINEIEEANRQLQLIKSTNENLEKVKPLLRDYISEKIIHDSINVKEFEEYLKILGLDSKMVYTMVLEINQKHENFTSSGKILLIRRTIEVIKENLESDNLIFNSSSSRFLTIIVFCKPQNTVDNYTLRLNSIDFAIQLRNLITKKMHIDLKVGISETVNCVEFLSMTYKHAVFSLNYGDNAINHYSDIVEVKNTKVYPKELEQTIIDSVFKNQIEVLKELHEEFVSSFYSKDNPVSSAKTNIMQLIIRILKEFSEKINDFDFAMDKGIIFNIVNILKEDNLNHIAVLSMQVIQELSKKAAEKFKNKNVYIIEKTKQYIENNYKNNLTLEDISDFLQISPYYLSRIFKKETSINLVDYITAVRINHAKEMLVNTDALIKQISTESGFSDPNYFCKVFRKTVGLTPTEFRNANRS